MISDTAPVMVRNTHDGPTVFKHHDSTVLEWAGVGDAQGGDVLPVPASYLHDPQFRKHVTLGIFVIDEGEGVEAETAEVHRSAWNTRMEQQKNASAAQMEFEQDNDLVILECIALPREGSRKKCGAPVSTRHKERLTTAPLCAEHKNLSAQYVAEETGRMNGSEPEVIWKKVSLAPRQSSRQTKGE
jgi:hypothetical protein